MPGAEFAGEPPDVLRAVFWDEDRDLAQPVRSLGSGWGLALAHPRAADPTPHRSSLGSSDELLIATVLKIARVSIYGR